MRTYPKDTARNDIQRFYKTYCTQHSPEDPLMSMGLRLRALMTVTVSLPAVGR